jgi:S-adenosyl methyltransferase
MTLGTPPSEDSHLPSFDPSVPNPARMWNYWPGGKDNFAADREAAEHGVRQFLDIGTGLPTADNTHDVAQRAAPGSKIVYVDYDPVVLTHAQALLTSSPEGVTDASSPAWTCSHPAWSPSTSGPSPVTSTPPPAPWSATAPSPANPEHPRQLTYGRRTPRRSGHPWDLITRVRLNHHDKSV